MISTSLFICFDLSNTSTDIFSFLKVQSKQQEERLNIEPFPTQFLYTGETEILAGKFYESISSLPFTFMGLYLSDLPSPLAPSFYYPSFQKENFFLDSMKGEPTKLGETASSCPLKSVCLNSKTTSGVSADFKHNVSPNNECNVWPKIQVGRKLTRKEIIFLQESGAFDEHFLREVGAL